MGPTAAVPTVLLGHILVCMQLFGFLDLHFVHLFPQGLGSL